jgi:hypothetical protein
MFAGRYAADARTIRHRALVETDFKGSGTGTVSGGRRAMGGTWGVRRLLSKALGAWLGTAVLVFVAMAAARSFVEYGAAARAPQPAAIAVVADAQPPAPAAGRAPALLAVDLPALRLAPPPGARHPAAPRPSRPALVTAAATPVRTRVELAAFPLPTLTSIRASLWVPASGSSG